LFSFLEKYSSIDETTLAGHPAITEFEGKVPLTIEPAPMMQLLPILVLGNTITPSPIKQLLPISIQS